MTLEASEATQNPVDIARSEFNKALTASEFNGGLVVAKIISLQRTLLAIRALSPQLIYHELGLAVNQGAERAQATDDQITASTLTELGQGFTLTLESLQPQNKDARHQPATPTATAALPMSEAKAPKTTPAATIERQETKRPLSPRQQEVLALIKTEPLNVGEIASKLGLSENYVKTMLSAIRRSGIAINHSEGKYRVQAE